MPAARPGRRLAARTLAARRRGSWGDPRRGGERGSPGGPAPGGQSRSVTQESLCVTSRSYQPKLPAGSGQYCLGWLQCAFDLCSRLRTHLPRAQAHLSRRSLIPPRRPTRGRGTGIRPAVMPVWPDRRERRNPAAHLRRWAFRKARPARTGRQRARSQLSHPCHRAAGPALASGARAAARPGCCRMAAPAPGGAGQRRHMSGQINRDHELVTPRASQPAGSVVQRCDGPRTSVHGNRVPTRDQPREARRGRVSSGRKAIEWRSAGQPARQMKVHAW